MDKEKARKSVKHPRLPFPWICTPRVVFCDEESTKQKEKKIQNQVFRKFGGNLTEKCLEMPSLCRKFMKAFFCQINGIGRIVKQIERHPNPEAIGGSNYFHCTPVNNPFTKCIYKMV